MKKFMILIPVYNDWESLIKLLNEINIAIFSIKDIEFNCVIINDASTIPAPNIKIPSNISSITMINMKKNKGHARCNAFGIRYFSKKNKFDHLILMDGDGEDRPEEIELLVKKALSDVNTSVVAKRIKRSEGIFFQFLYQLHKVITLMFTGKNINFGNYSCLTKNDVNILSTKASLWSSFSGSLKKHVSKLNSVNSIRGIRYFGPSKMSLFRLGIHSFSIIAVFKRTVFIRSTILILISTYIMKKMFFSVLLFQLMLVIFNLLIYIVSLRENEQELINSDQNEQTSKLYTH
jgi:hypothetical protein